MKKILHPAESRGRVEQDWLLTYHTFSFASYHHPERMRFGTLRVLNDDYIKGESGFDFHDHRDMEIITILLKGAIAHRDNQGNSLTIHAGEIQVMSAGTGITHSEMNPTRDTTNLLQIWVFPNQKGVTPRYDQKKFDPKGREGNFQSVVCPLGKGEGVGIHQDAYFSLGRFKKGQSFQYTLKNPENGVYLFLIEGEARIAHETLKPRDGLGLSELESFEGQAIQVCELLAMEIPMRQ